jgi:indolepyruvate ferredoxin oxidoreductase alpha subunit
MHKLLTDDPGKKMLMLGNEAIVRGALEAGVACTATYPGTPSSEISLNFFHISKESELYFEYSTNEKTALEMTAAAANCGIRSMCIMKHVGVNVAADALMTLAYLGVKGGLVLLTADDPYMFSSQNEQDNRYYGKLSGLPILEPSSVEEAARMTTEAFALSEQLQEPVILRTTTRINHSTAVVSLEALKEPNTRGNFVKDPLNYVAVPAVSRRLHAKLLENIEKATTLSNQSAMNFITGTGPFGIVCNGVSYHYVNDAVRDLGVEDRTSILRIGFSHPLPDQIIKSFLQDKEKVLVVEEGEPYMEEGIKAFAQEAGQTLPIAGKAKALFSRLYELDPATVRRVMAAYFGFSDTPRQVPDLSDIPEIPQRPPTLCAGCSHRAVFHAVKKAADGMDVIYPTDIGCYTLGFLPPLSMGDFLICMGSSAGTAAGFSRFTDKKIVAYIGDSTFFHSGIPGLINGVFNNHNFTLIILDNRTTAMTGHQPNPGVDMEELDFAGYNRLELEKVVTALGVKHVSVIKPFNIKKSVAQLKEAFAFQGVSVVIAREKCSLYAKSLKQLRGTQFQVTDRCIDHRTCITELACPAFYIDKGRVKINASLCWGCSVCAQICPERAIAPIKKEK